MIVACEMVAGKRGRSSKTGAQKAPVCREAAAGIRTLDLLHGKR